MDNFQLVLLSILLKCFFIYGYFGLCDVTCPRSHNLWQIQVLPERLLTLNPCGHRSIVRHLAGANRR